MKTYCRVFICLVACLQIAIGQIIGYPGCASNVALGGPLAIGPGNALAANVIDGIGSLGPVGNLPISAVTPVSFGDVAVAGELPVGGTTAVAGNVPVIGYVMFEGYVPAGGTVQLASNCGCNVL